MGSYMDKTLNSSTFHFAYTHVFPDVPPRKDGSPPDGSWLSSKRETTIAMHKGKLPAVTCHAFTFLKGKKYTQHNHIVNLN